MRDARRTDLLASLIPLFDGVRDEQSQVAKLLA
jgi:hypothetical protein